MQTEMKNDDAIKSSGRASPLTPASRIPRWMYQLMCERGSHQPRNRSRSHVRMPSDHLGERPRPAAPLEQHDSSAVHSETSTAAQSDCALTECGDQSRPAVEANADCHSCDTAVLAPPPPSCAPEDSPGPSPQPLTDPHQPHHRTTYRDSYGDFSSASSNASSSTSYSGGFDSSRSASSVTSASSAMTFSAATAGWTGQAGSPSSAPSPSFSGGRKRSPAGCRATAAFSEAESSGKVPPRSHVVVDDDPEVTLCLSRLHLPSSSELQILAPDEADTTPLASTSRLASEPITAATAAPSPPSPTTTATSHISLETTATTNTSPIAPIPLVDDGTLLAPENFATVSMDLYRSSFPRKQHFPFLKNLGLKSVMVLVQEPYPEENAEFLAREGIQLFQYGIPGNKEPFVSIPDDKVVAALTTILDKRNHPMLIHCNKGKHRTGCVVGCLRRIQSWSLTSIFDEYRRYSTPKSRAMDLQFIEAFGGLPDVWRLCDREQLPRWPTLEPPPVPAPSDPSARPP